MGGTKRETLRLPRPDEVASFGEGQVAEAETALEDIQALKARLNAAMQEIDSLKKRAEAPRDGTVLTRGKFVARLARKLSPNTPVNGCVARVCLSNFDDVRRCFGDEAAEELCDEVGRWLAGHVRNTDLVGRVGAATYAVYFGFGDHAAIKAKMDKLTARIEQTCVAWRKETLHAELNVEIGAVCSHTEESAAEIAENEVSHAEAC